jgi:hypothetical protein
MAIMANPQNDGMAMGENNVVDIKNEQSPSIGPTRTPAMPARSRPSAGEDQRDRHEEPPHASSRHSLWEGFAGSTRLPCRCRGSPRAAPLPAHPGRRQPSVRSPTATSLTAGSTRRRAPPSDRPPGARQELDVQVRRDHVPALGPKVRKCHPERREGVVIPGIFPAIRDAPDREGAGGRSQRTVRGRWPGRHGGGLISCMARTARSGPGMHSVCPGVG